MIPHFILRNFLIDQKIMMKAEKSKRKTHQLATSLTSSVFLHFPRTFLIPIFHFHSKFSIRKSFFFLSRHQNVRKTCVCVCVCGFEKRKFGKYFPFRFSHDKNLHFVMSHVIDSCVHIDFAIFFHLFFSLILKKYDDGRNIKDCPRNQKTINSFSFVT